MNFDKLCLKCMQEKVEYGVCTSCGAKRESAQEPVFALNPGSILHGRYLVGAVLGHGGFGITYIGMDLKTNERVAIKEFMPNGLSTRIPGTTAVTVYSNSEDYLYGLKQFIDEARTIYRYRSNPNIISVTALFEENNTAYYVMEYLNGFDLKKYLAQRGESIPFSEALRLLSSVFEALSAVHKENIIHRDISPDNIYICKNGQVKLLDFGAARVALIGKSKSLSIILKRGYAPEEQYHSHGVQGPWTDIYALAATLYRCITGHIPLESIERLHRDGLVPPSKLCSGLPNHAERAIIKALSVRGEHRYRTIDEFKHALEKSPIDNPDSPSEGNYLSEAMPSSKGKRIVALLIDGIIVSLLFIVLQYAGTISAGYYKMLFLTGFLYGSLCEASSMRGTIGKKLLGLRVADILGNNMEPGKIILRNLIKYSPSGLILFLPYYIGSIFGIINFGYALINSKNQTLHDRVAGSIVLGRSITNSNIHEESQHEIKPNKSAIIQCISGYYMGAQFPVHNTVTLGRNPKVCNIIFPGDVRGVSGIHCELYFDGSLESAIIKDLGSTYGTLAGNQMLSRDQRAALHDGDSFTIGDNNKFIIHIR